MDAYLNQIKTLLERIELTDSAGVRYEYEKGISCMIDLLKDCKEKRACLYLCGNGGSAGIAQHMTADFFKNAGIKTHDMYGQTILTCIANDLAYECVFSKQLELLADRDDILVAISSSGESENILRAIETVKAIGGHVITLTGFRKENRIRKIGDMNIYVPVCHYGMTESIHNLILQQCVDMIMEAEDMTMKR